VSIKSAGAACACGKVRSPSLHTLLAEPLKLVVSVQTLPLGNDRAPARRLFLLRMCTRPLPSPVVPMQDFMCQFTVSTCRRYAQWNRQRSDAGRSGA